MSKKIILNCIKIGVCLLILTALLLRTAYVVRDKQYTSVQDNFRQLPKDSVDVVFIGQSHCFCSIDPNLLADEYGIESFMLATSAQTVPMSYYAAKEAIECQHPKKIVMEVAYCANDFRTVEDGMTHAFFDGMPNGKAKKEAIKDLIDKEDRIYYYLNFGMYHTRWKDLTEDDYKSNLTMKRGEYYSEDVFPNWDYPVVAADEKKNMPEEMERYMDLLVELCKEENVELILFCAPFGIQDDFDDRREDLKERQRIFNYIEDYAKEKNVRYYNLFNELDSIYEYGLNDETDWKDSQHLNASGQKKLTRYMAEKGYFD